MSVIGENIDAYCLKCKLLVAHVIMLKVDGAVSKVKCNTCGAQHKYRPKMPAAKKSTVSRPPTLKETIAKRVEKMMGELHPMYGKKHSDEVRLRISKKRKGKLVGTDNPFFGKTHTDETKRKISEAGKGHIPSLETRAKTSISALANAPFQKKSKPVLCLNNGVIYYGIIEASRQLNLHRQCIRMVCNGDLKQTGGYKFEWIKK